MLAESGSLRFLIHVSFKSLRDFGVTGVTMGLPPHAPLGDYVRETRIVAQALFAISDFHHAESRTAGA